MNPNFPSLLLNGFIICLCAQLLIVGIYNIYNRTYKNIVLGLYCIITAVTIIYTLFLPQVTGNFFYNILSSYKHVYLPSLLFLYIQLTQRLKNPKRQLVTHLLPPTLIQIGYLYMKFFQQELFTTYSNEMYSSMNVFILASYILYSFKVFPIFKMLKGSLKKHIFIRYKTFFILAVTYGILIVLESFLSFFLKGELYTQIFEFLSLYFYPSISTIFYTYVLVFAFLEAPKLRDKFVHHKIYSGFDTIQNEKYIQQFIEEHFDQNKTYLKPNDTINELLITSDIRKADWSVYLKKRYGQTQTEFVNHYRIEEFKKLITEKENLKYDLIGIALKAGFKSKASFYRNFKNAEGITPKQYVAQQISS